MNEQVRRLKFGAMYVGAAIAFMLFWIVLCLWVFIPLLQKLIADQVDPWIESDPQYRLEEIEEIIGSKIPKDSIDLEYNSKRGYGFFIRLSFKAPPESMSQFVENLCDGILYQGYDPFDTVDRYEDGAHLIRASDFVYFSYSPDAPPTYFGNRCRRGGHIQLIGVDQSTTDLHLVRFEMLGSPDQASVPLPTWGTLNTTMPVPDLPLVTPGLALTDGEYVLIAEEFCIEMRFDWMNEDPYRHLIGAEVEIILDDQPTISTSITKWGMLAPKDYDGKSPSLPFNYCFFEARNTGVHRVIVRITPVGQAAEEYSWDFRVVS